MAMQHSVTSMNSGLEQMENLFSLMEMPQIDLDDVPLWFQKLSIIFKALNMGDGKIRFGIAATLLKLHPLQKVSEIVTAIETRNFDNPYEALEKSMKACFKKSAKEKVMTALGLGTISETRMKPSLFLAYLDLILADVTIDNVLRELMLGFVPPRLLFRLNVNNSATELSHEIDCFVDTNGKIK